LPEADQELLEAASVAGGTFAVAAVAAGIAPAPETLEARYTALARHGWFIRASGTETWPDGTVTACYQFVHALYHEVVYARVSAGHRVRLHQQVGTCKEAGYGAQARQIAAELAVHFARGRDAWRAVKYLQYAGENALRRSAYMVGGICLFLGELTAARTCLEQGMALYEPQRHQAYAVLHGVDLGVVCLCHAAFTLWLLGYPNQALQRSHATLALAQALGHPYSLAFGLTWVTMLHQARGEEAATQERAETLITLCTEQVVPYWLAGGRVLQGWVLAERGQAEAGIAQMCQGLAAWQVTGAEIILPYHLSLLAETHGRRDQAAEGLSVLTKALSLAERHEERWWEAELHRLTGDLCLKQAVPDVSQAEACFQQALAVAHRQQAKSLELRAAISLSRLWQHQGNRAAAYDLLAPVYGWFTEGFDTADLQEAKALLEDLEI
jgi:adenylate cyclase